MNQSDADIKPLSNVVKSFLDEVDWHYESEVDGPARTTFKTHVTAEFQTFRVFIETDEQREVVEVYLYGPYVVPPPRIPHVVTILNRINVRATLGRLAIRDDGEPAPIQWKGSIDVEGSKLAVQQISTLISAGYSTLDFHHEQLACVSFGAMSPDEAWTAFIDSRARAKREEDKIPEAIPEALRSQLSRSDQPRGPAP